MQETRITLAIIAAALGIFGVIRFGYGISVAHLAQFGNELEATYSGPKIIPVERPERRDALWYFGLQEMATGATPLGLALVAACVLVGSFKSRPTMARPPVVALLLAVSLLLGLSGCAIPTLVTKSIVVEKDAEGKIIKQTETETVLQHIDAGRVKLEFLRIPESPDEKSNPVVFQPGRR